MIENFIPTKANLDEIHDYINNNIIKIEKSQLEKFEQGSQLIFYKAFMELLIPIDTETISNAAFNMLESRNQKLSCLEIYKQNFNDFQFLNLHHDFKKNVLNCDITSDEFLSGDAKKIKHFLTSLINFHKFKFYFRGINFDILCNFDNSHSKKNQIFFQIKNKNVQNNFLFTKEKGIKFKKAINKNKKLNKNYEISLVKRETHMDSQEKHKEFMKLIANEKDEPVCT